MPCYRCSTVQFSNHYNIQNLWPGVPHVALNNQPMSATRGSKNQPLKQIGVLEGSSENATTTSAKFELGAHVSSRLCHLPSPLYKYKTRTIEHPFISLQVIFITSHANRSKQATAYKRRVLT